MPQTLPSWHRDVCTWNALWRTVLCRSGLSQGLGPLRHLPTLPDPVRLGSRLRVSMAQRLSGMPTSCSLAPCPDFCSNMDQIDNRLPASALPGSQTPSLSPAWISDSQPQPLLDLRPPGSDLPGYQTSSLGPAWISNSQPPALPGSKTPASALPGSQTPRGCTLRECDPHLANTAAPGIWKELGKGESPNAVG